MTEYAATLRQITDAIAAFRGLSDADKERLYSRARTMRDRGLINTASPKAQGREIRYSGPDIAAAVVAITISLNGGSTGQIEAINMRLRKFGADYTTTDSIPAYEENFEAILSGPQIFIRFDMVLLSDGESSFSQTDTKMGVFEDLGLADSFDSVDSFGHRRIVTQSNLFPVSSLVRPVIATLFSKG
ncbi:MAG: hypothetical protein IKG52_09720 [Rhodobacteraceae bacterium]|nr:hypothetical protein [Paracoccaceae bacterium]